jgi:glycosyltransferase involved in cell wall biosynthesis
VVLASYREGTPRSLLEAAAMGRPLIAANSVGTREPVEEGINGFLCRPKDPTDLCRAMEAMLDLSVDARKQMGTESRRIAVERFDEQIVIDKYLAAIALLADSGKNH